MERKCSHFIANPIRQIFCPPVIAYFLSHLERSTSSRHSDKRETECGGVGRTDGRTDRGMRRVAERKQKTGRVKMGEWERLVVVVVVGGEA